MTPDYLDDPKAEQAFFEGMADFGGISEQRAREIFAQAVAEDEEKGGS